MKLLFSLALALIGTSSLAQTAPPDPEHSPHFRDADPQVRLAAVENLLLVGAPHENEILTRDTLGVIMQAAEDPDIRVKRLAANGLLMAAYMEMRVILPHKSDPKLVDLQAYDEFKQALLKAAADPDALVRHFALCAYAMTYKLTAELEAKIMTEIDGPPAPERDMRAALLQCLLNDYAPSPKAKHYIVQKLEDTNLDVVAAGDLYHMKSPPIDALPKLLAKLREAKDEGAKEVYVSAMGSYGAEASKYLQTLEQMQATESFKVTWDNYRRAIENIRHPSEDYNGITPDQKKKHP